MEALKDLKNKKCLYIVAFLFLVTVGLLIFTHYEVSKQKKMMEEVEYYDSLNRYNKIYYEKSFSSLKKENRQLYDSLKQYKDKISFLIQFTHQQEHNTGVVTTKPTVKDSVVKDAAPITIPQIARTYEYISEVSDTFQYKLNVNSYTEPLWYSLNVKTKSKFTIVNKDEGDGLNHIVIDPNGNGTVSDVTVFKKKEKRSVWNRISFGPAVTAGYDVVNRQWGIMVGGSVTIDLK